MIIEYKVGLDRRNEHLYSLKMHFVAPVKNPSIQMSSWTPGSYLIRDYAKHVQDIIAKKNGEIKPITQLSKNTWQVSAQKGDEITIEYELYGFELTVRTNYLDNRKGLIVGCNTFFYLLDQEGDPLQYKYIIDVSLPENWKIFTSLRKEQGKYVAQDLDELLDSPIALAASSLVDSLEYSYQEIPCEIAVIGDRGNHDIQTLQRDLQKLQDQSVKMFGELPYDRYVWMLYIVGKGGGGLEHKYSNVSIVNRFSFGDPKKYHKQVLRLESHEHFHVYNVKRIRPEVLGPFDYSNEVYTTALWIAEGLTNYYESIYLLREKIINIETYLDWKKEDIMRYLNTPGREHISLAGASFNAWTKLYKSDENTINSYISYYLKGGLVGFLLNIHIISSSEGKFSLDDVYRHLWNQYKKDKSRGYDENKFKDIIYEVTGVNCTEFFDKYIYGTEELPFLEYFRKAGIDFELNFITGNELDGVKLKKNKVTNVLSTSTWIKAGLSPKDKILALNRYEVKDKKDIQNILAGMSEGDKLLAHVMRDGILLELEGVVQKKKVELKLRLSEDTDDISKLVRQKIFEI